MKKHKHSTFDPKNLVELMIIFVCTNQGTINYGNKSAEEIGEIETLRDSLA